MQETFSHTDELGYSHQEFFRAFGPAIENRPYTYENRRVSFDYEGGRITIELSEQQVRRIASIELPYLFATFRFYDLNETQRQAFTTRFNLYFQRGGG